MDYRRIHRNNQVQVHRQRSGLVEIAEFECAWLDGRPATPDKLLDALAPLFD